MSAFWRASEDAARAGTHVLAVAGGDGLDSTWVPALAASSLALQKADISIRMTQFPKPGQTGEGSPCGLQTVDQASATDICAYASATPRARRRGDRTLAASSLALQKADISIRMTQFPKPGQTGECAARDEPTFWPSPGEMVSTVTLLSAHSGQSLWSLDTALIRIRTRRGTRYRGTRSPSGVWTSLPKRRYPALRRSPGEMVSTVTLLSAHSGQSLWSLDTALSVVRGDLGLSVGSRSRCILTRSPES
jgi:hypothetical protein